MAQQDSPIVILGAGLAGLSAAYHLDAPYQIFESAREAGGVARSFTVNGFTFDHAIHVLYTKDPYASELIRRLLGDNFREHSRSSWIYSHNTYTPYPYQAHTFGLPEAVIRENLLGLIEARYKPANQAVQNFEEWILATFGSGIAKNFMIPFNRKLWATEPRSMGYEWISDRVMTPELEEIFRGAYQATSGSLGPNAQFWYPLCGGTGALAAAFQREVNPVKTEMKFHTLDPETHTVQFLNGESVRYSKLIGTLPLPTLLKSIHGLPSRIMTLIPLLRSNRVVTVNLGIARESISEKHWVYFPEDEFRFHRISFPANFSRDLAPQGMSSIMIELSESDERPIDRSCVVQETIDQLIRIGILRTEDRILCKQLIEIDPAYIIYDTNHRTVCEEIHKYLRSIDVYSCGRFGEWEYLNMDQSILSGMRAARLVEDRFVTSDAKLHLRPTL